MVYSQTTRTRSISSITNQPSGGGNMKAGLPYIIGRETNSSIALRKTSQLLSVLQLPLKSTTRQSSSIGMRFSRR
jgi:hypothetical protein